jgi:hypothetical protein
MNRRTAFMLTAMTLGDAFVYMDRETGRLATIHGYPTHKLIQKG